MNRLFSGTYLIEIKINGNTDKISLPNILDLYGKRIKSIEFVDACRIRLPAACHSRMRMTTCREPNGCITQVQILISK